jgi:hypothetical protein
MAQHHSAMQTRTGSGLFSPPPSINSSSSPSASGSSPRPAIISMRRMWAAKGFLEI